MKIYATQSDIDLEQFIGSDLWIRAEYTPSGHDDYIKITEKYTEEWDGEVYTYFNYYAISARIIDIPYKTRVTQTDLDCLWYFKRYQLREQSASVDRFLQEYTIKIPLDILSEEEIKSITDEAVRMYL